LRKLVQTRQSKKFIGRDPQMLRWGVVRGGRWVSIKYY